MQRLRQIAAVALCVAVVFTVTPALTSALQVHQQAGAQNQPQAQPGTIRVQVRLVPVDVIVTDRGGRPVTDLKKEDFQIFENGRLQEIRHFSIQELTPTSPEEAAPLRPVQTLDLAPQSSRTFLILMGRGRIQTPFGAVDAVIRFVRKDLLPQDRVAVFAYNRATTFTTDHEEVARVLERYKALHDRIESWLELRMTGLAAIYGSKEIPKSFQGEIDKIFTSPAGSASQQLPSGELRGGATMTADALKVLEQALISPDSPSRTEFTAMESDAVSDLTFDEYTATYAAMRQDMQNLYTCINFMRFMSGEKHLLFFTADGLFLSRLEYEEGLAAFANGARVALDTFQTGGMTTSASFSRAFALSSLRNVSELTGGRAAIRQDIGQALKRINETTRAEYLLGYYPRDENWNGKYRRIEVKVTRPGVQAAFRHGYFARETVPSFNLEEALATSRIGAAAAYSADINDIVFRIQTAEREDTLGPPQLEVSLEIDARKIGLKQTESIFTGKLYIAVFCADAKGKVLGEKWGKMEINVPEERQAEIMQSGLAFSVIVPRKVPRPTLKVVLYDTASGLVGSKLYKAK